MEKANTHTQTASRYNVAYTCTCTVHVHLHLQVLPPVQHLSLSADVSSVGPALLKGHGVGPVVHVVCPTMSIHVGLHCVYREHMDMQA